MSRSSGSETRWRGTCRSTDGLTARLAVLCAAAAMMAVTAASADKAWSSHVTSAHPVRGLSNGDGRVCSETWCLDDKWFAGENRSTVSPYNLNQPDATFGDMNGIAFTGADFGISVYLPLQDRTVVYMGDSWDVPSGTGCVNSTACNDAILSFTNMGSTPSGGINARILVDSAAPNRFAPLVIPGVNELGNAMAGYVGMNSVPSGAAWRLKTVRIWNPITNSYVYTVFDSVWLWYSAIDSSNVKKTYLACSIDGISFGGCYGTANATPFSTDKFTGVSPVPIDADRWDDIADHCVSSPTDSMCKLKTVLAAAGISGDGFLLFGVRTGSGYYRKSGLFLGYLPAAQNTPYYWNGTTWTTSESAATALLAPSLLYPATYFGEHSVQIAEDGAGEPYLVLLYNNAFSANILMRGASLYAPNKLSAAKTTENRGYGPFILTQTIDGTGGTLKLYHMISGWNGVHRANDPNGNRAPYGVYSTPLKNTSHADFAWPPTIP
jgi:hypothetical protein